MLVSARLMSIVGPSSKRPGAAYGRRNGRRRRATHADVVSLQISLQQAIDFDYLFGRDGPRAMSGLVVISISANPASRKCRQASALRVAPGDRRARPRVRCFLLGAGRGSPLRRVEKHSAPHSSEPSRACVFQQERIATHRPDRCPWQVQPRPPIRLVFHRTTGTSPFSAVATVYSSVPSLR